MIRQHKIWGERWIIREDSMHGNYFLKLLRGYRCSWHYHTTKYNLFVVLWGKIIIITQREGEPKRETVLLEGNSFLVEPNQFHEFIVCENSGVIEEMFVEYDREDIIRLTKGSEHRIEI